MSVPWDVIRYSLGESARELEPPEGLFTGVRMLTGRADDARVVYIAPRSTGGALIFPGGRTAPAAELDGDPLCALTAVQDMLDRFSSLELELASASAEHSYQRMAEAVSGFTGLKTILLDRSLRCFALAPDEPEPGDPEWTHLRSYGFSDPDTIRRLDDSGAFEEMRAFTGPSVKRADSGMPSKSLVTNIFVGSALEGRILLLGAEFTPLDARASELLANAVRHIISGGDPFGPVRGKGPFYALINDLVRGIKYSDAQIRRIAMQFDVSNDSRYHILALPLNSAPEHYEYYERLLGASIHCFCVEHEGCLAALVVRPAGAPDTPALLRSWLEAASVRGGLSMEFSDLNLISLHYRQAIIAAKSDAPDPLRRFEDCVSAYLASRLSASDSELLSHPAAAFLRAYDAKNDTSYYETLKLYLQCERSLVETSKRLFIHRNTVQYRLRMINELTGLDLSDPVLRSHLYLTFVIAENAGEKG